jgi:hypothetical protein
MTERTLNHNPTPALRKNPSTAIPGWVSVVVILGALLTAMGAVIALVKPAMLAPPHVEINSAVRVYAGYLAARNFALAFMLLALLVLRARRALGNLMVLVGLVQFLDVIMDCVEGRWTIASGVLVFGLIFLAGAARLCGAPFWRREAWFSSRG